ncbi:MAG: hypothetical protein KJZ86_06420 [Caldilineaceae bacterium]|nr:hypothetical protein [Caldilineaceae bacterium]
MARFYANENFPFPVVEELRRLGHDVLTPMPTHWKARARQLKTETFALYLACREGHAGQRVARSLLLGQRRPDSPGWQHRIQWYNEAAMKTETNEL